MCTYVGRLRSIVPAKAPCTLPEPWRHSHGVLRYLWADWTSLKAQFQVDCRVVLTSLADVFKAEVFVQVECDVYKNKLPGDSLKSNCSGILAKQVASVTFPDSCRNMEEPGNEVPREKGTREVIELWLYKLEIKIPAIYSRRCSRFIFLS